MILSLPKTFTKPELAALLKPYGKLSACSMVMDEKSGMSKGFGFAEMPDADAQAAIKALHGKKLGGQRLRIKAVDTSE